MKVLTLFISHAILQCDWIHVTINLDRQKYSHAFVPDDQFRHCLKLVVKYDGYCRLYTVYWNTALHCSLLMFTASIFFHCATLQEVLMVLSCLLALTHYHHCHPVEPQLFLAQMHLKLPVSNKRTETATVARVWCSPSTMTHAFFMMEIVRLHPQWLALL